jgi:nitric oxide reductase subunit B
VVGFQCHFLLAGIALLGWHHAVTHSPAEEPHKPPAFDPMRAITVTPSMLATAKYFWVLLALFLVQIALGAITAHYQIEGQVAYGFPLAEVLPYSLSRTWHTQLAVLWNAVAWLGTGLYIAPAISGYEPAPATARRERAVALPDRDRGRLLHRPVARRHAEAGAENNFWFGHQGWEYADTGRF